MLDGLHDGGYSSQYWRFASMGEDSLARLRPSAGLTVAVLNDPGTGVDDVPVAGFQEQAALVVETVAGLLAGPLAAAVVASYESLITSSGGRPWSSPRPELNIFVAVLRGTRCRHRPIHGGGGMEADQRLADVAVIAPGDAGGGTDAR